MNRLTIFSQHTNLRSHYSLTAVVLSCLLLASCGGGSSSEPTGPTTPPPAPPPPEPSSLSLTTIQSGPIDESTNPKVSVRVQLDSPASEEITAALAFAGTATRNFDYVVDKESVTIPVGSSSADVILDVYRDFDVEGSESVEVTVTTATGPATISDSSTLTLSIEDDEQSGFDKFGRPGGFFGRGFAPLVEMLPLMPTEEGVFIVVLVSFNPPEGETRDITVEWSTDPDFYQDVQVIGTETIEHLTDEELSQDPLVAFFGRSLFFVLPNETLLVDSAHYIRGYIGELEHWRGFDIEPQPNVFIDGFLTDENAQVRTTCEVGSRTPSGTDDPLLPHQWHIQNTGQTAFANSAGKAGEDMQMTAAIGEGVDGSGIKIVVIDSGLEICHPDLADNIEPGGSYNFGHENRMGAAADDPFYFSLLGDHGTSVAGVAAAVADNGFGGRGVASGASLVGFNPLEAAGSEDFEGLALVEVAFLESLGGSSEAPDSASGHIFNMSFGLELPGENISEEYRMLYKMTTSQLRDGLGALYVKAIGNAFTVCDRFEHPLNREIGCISGNADPDQNIPWLLPIGAYNADGVKSSYSAAASNIWVVAPGGEDGLHEPAIITTDQAGNHGGYSEGSFNALSSDNDLNLDGDYVNAFGGTSAATPNAAGAIALILDANPQLTWRDVKHILASTSRKLQSNIQEVRAAFNGTPYIVQHGWTTNAAGFEFHNWYGFGAINVDAAIAMARTHAPDSLGSFVESDWFDSGVSSVAPLAIPDADGVGISTTVTVANIPSSAKVESVMLSVSLDHTLSYDVGIRIESPSGTQSIVNQPFNSALGYSQELFEWHLLSNAFYGENLNGVWTIHVVDLAKEDTGSLTGAQLRFYYGDAE